MNKPKLLFYIHRVAAEKKQSELLARLEEAQSSHHEEMNDMRGQLDSQKQLMTLSDKKVVYSVVYLIVYV